MVCILILEDNLSDNSKNVVIEIGKGNSNSLKSMKNKVLRLFHQNIRGLRNKTNGYAPYPQSSSTLWNYSKCGVYTVESEAGC
jgi:hypothetical protein